MQNFINKLNQYEILNNLLPGAVLYYILEKENIFIFSSSEILVYLFISYFLGFIVNRLGSIIIEPILKAIKLIKMADYCDYVSAEKKDPKISDLSTINNMYRTFTALAVTIACIKAYKSLIELCPCLDQYIRLIAFIIIIVIFILSYRKQTNYICKRVGISSNKETTKEKKYAVRVRFYRNRRKNKRCRRNML